MPRKDKTFSDKDIIRIIKTNLTDQENVNVVLSICKGVKIEDFGFGPILVPISSSDQALEGVDLVKFVTSLVTGIVVSKLPDILAEVLDFAISSAQIEGAINKIVELK